MPGPTAPSTEARACFAEAGLGGGETARHTRLCICLYP